MVEGTRQLGLFAASRGAGSFKGRAASAVTNGGFTTCRPRQAEMYASAVDRSPDAKRRSDLLQRLTPTSARVCSCLITAPESMASGGVEAMRSLHPKRARAQIDIARIILLNEYVLEASADRLFVLPVLQ